MAYVLSNTYQSSKKNTKKTLRENKELRQGPELQTYSILTRLKCNYGNPQFLELPFFGILLVHASNLPNFCSIHRDQRFQVDIT